jgi:integration host factor subunit alpha
MTLVKENLIESVCDRCGLSKHQSRTMVETLFELIKKALEAGDDVLISGFGKFIVREKAQRRGRNPATGRDLTLDARRVVTFKCSPVLKEKMDGGGRGRRGYLPLEKCQSITPSFSIIPDQAPTNLNSQSCDLWPHVRQSTPLHGP